MPLSVGVVFGGASPEHEVSVISGLQAAAALDPQRFAPVPVYIAKSGRWYTGDGLLDIAGYEDLDRLTRGATEVTLRARDGRGGHLVGDMPEGLLARVAGRPLDVPIDVLLLVLHGGPGESGAVQGVCEAAGVAYTGSGVLGSALGMDKVLTKMLCRDQGVPVVDWVAFREADWQGSEDHWLEEIEHRLGLPVVVKPARLGSSIGISVAKDRDTLDGAIEEAMRYDEKVVVERAVTALREVNCSVLGTPRAARASALEQPVRSAGEELLTFSEKYERGSGAKGGAVSDAAKAGRAEGGMASLGRLIPAPIPDSMADEIRDLAVRVFRLFECSGVARIDFLIDDADGQVYFNEINTIPGSLSFYLWEPAGVPFGELLAEMIGQAVERQRDEAGRVRTFETNILSAKSMQGLKAAKR
jgi:D-alanine-D-alanine ligase